MVRNTYIYPPEPSMRIIADIIEYTSAEMPKFNSISISGYHMQEAGANLVQELAFTLADGREYVRAAIARGMNVDDFAGRLSFFFAIGMNFFMEAAKLRAARMLWTRIMQEFKPQKPGSLMLRTHCQTSGVSLQEQDPYNNVIRTAYEAMAAVLGGTQSLHTNGMDEALALPTEKSVEIALRTQQVIAYESGAADTVDPLGGAYAIEWLTDQIEAQANAYLNQIDNLGGALAAVEQGFIQREIQEAAYRTQRAIEKGDQVVVGVNRFQTGESPKPDLLRVDENVRVAQMAALAELRATRDGSRVAALLQQLETAARDPRAPLMPLIIEAVEAYATLGEICDALRRVFGEYTPESWL